MASLWALGKWIWRRNPWPPKNYSNVRRPSISSDVTMEEEMLKFYEPEQYYPVHIGQVFQSRYQAVGKLGYGAYSTVWLCRDLR